MGLLNSEVGRRVCEERILWPDWQMRLFLTGLLVLLTLSTVPITLAGLQFIQYKHTDILIPPAI